MEPLGEEKKDCACDDCGGEKIGQDGVGARKREEPVDDVAGSGVGEEIGHLKVSDGVEEMRVGNVLDEIAEERDGGDER
jgi:hypothetical protein